MAPASVALQLDLEDSDIQASPKVLSLGNSAVTPPRRIGRLEQVQGQVAQLLDRAHIADVYDGDMCARHRHLPNP